MSDIIQLLPDSVANQIAAGEVIQRPASVVKELLENSVDAGSTSIQLIIKDAGRTLIQVIDNGCGMSDTDARMSFERHATSKIKAANDLFAIQTKGFRGEALASIAAIAHVEMKSRLTDEQLGTKILVEGTDVKSQEPCQCPVGTSIAVKNLFYNVPARRNFLKSNSVETKHIIDEFQRVALAHPAIEFSMHHNKTEVFQLKKNGLRQRIVGLSGSKTNKKLVPLEENTDLIGIKGFIGKPEFARKTRGEQFFFVNNRYIKSGYLHHAVKMAFEDLLPKDTHPSYFIYFDARPSSIDINIHPTKTEIKFEDEKAVYAILRSTVKKSLGKYNIAPTIDFDQESSMNFPPPPKNKEIRQPEIRFNENYNPFQTDTEGSSPSRPVDSPLQKSNKRNWSKLYEQMEKQREEVRIPQEETENEPEGQDQIEAEKEKSAYQLHKRFIVTHIKSGMLLIDQYRAHQRILYEQFLAAMEEQKSVSQKQLFPQTVELPPQDFELVKELEEDIRALGIDLREFGRNTYVIEGVAQYIPLADAGSLLEELLENYKNNLGGNKIDKKDNLARSLAKKAAVRYGTKLENEEMNSMIDRLFACQMPYYAPNGKPTLITITLEDLDKKFDT